jgi:hypothetical protein
MPNRLGNGLNRKTLVVALNQKEEAIRTYPKGEGQFAQNSHFGRWVGVKRQEAIQDRGLCHIPQNGAEVLFV